VEDLLEGSWMEKERARDEPLQEGRANDVIHFSPCNLPILKENSRGEKKLVG
jgi:hypothetical protein